MPVSRKRGRSGPTKWGRSRPSKKRRSGVKYKKGPRGRARGIVQKAVRSAIFNMSETKMAFFTICTNQVVNHNAVVNLFNNAFECARGTLAEQVGAQSNGNGARIGNKIYIKGISVALHIEAQQYRPRTHWKIFLVRNKESKDTSVSATTIYEGHNSNLMLDWIDTSKVDILYSKKFMISMPNTGTALAANTGAGVVPDPPGTFDHESGGQFWTVSTNPSWRGKFYVPINKTIQYNDDGVTPATMRYQWVMQAYDNYAAPSSGNFWTTYPLGHVSMTQKMYFKDV